MNTSSTAAPIAASAESPRLDRNWAPIIRAELEAIGCNVIQIPEHINKDQAEVILTDLMSQALAHKAASA